MDLPVSEELLEELRALRAERKRIYDIANCTDVKEWVKLPDKDKMLWFATMIELESMIKKGLHKHTPQLATLKRFTHTAAGMVQMHKGQWVNIHSIFNLHEISTTKETLQ